MIISFSGRKGAGKTVLRLEAVRRGFKKISFADRLKEITAELYGWTVESLNCPVGKEQKLDKPLVYNAATARKLADIIHAERPLKEDERRIETRRDALQYLGTDVLREYDSEFHVKELKKQITPGENYVLDDQRFANEYALLKELDAIFIYVMRPYYFEYSNHRSEIDLLRTDFKYLFVNNSDLKAMAGKFNTFMDISREPAEIEANQTEFTNNRAFIDINEDSAYWGGVVAATCRLNEDWPAKGHAPIEVRARNKSLMESLLDFVGVDSEIVERSSPLGPPAFSALIYSDFLVDDLKLWNFYPGGYIPAKGIPEIVVKSEKLRQRWQAGFDHGMYSGTRRVSKANAGAVL